MSDTRDHGFVHPSVPMSEERTHLALEPLARIKTRSSSYAILWALRCLEKCLTGVRRRRSQYPNGVIGTCPDLGINWAISMRRPLALTLPAGRC
jgi:hypothetical protein